MLLDILPLWLTEPQEHFFIPLLCALIRFAIDLVLIPYELIVAFFTIFMSLARLNIFDIQTYEDIANNMYAIIGVLSLFVLAYHVLTLIVDPDKNKGYSETYKMIKKFTVSLILIVLCPTIFKYASNIVNIIIDTNVIPRIITGIKEDNSDSGRALAGGLLGNFFTLEESYANENSVYGKPVDWFDFSSCKDLETTKKQEVTNFRLYKCFSRNIADDTGFGEDNINYYHVRFDGILALICGWYAAISICKMCFDMALRLIKLMFYQLCSPLCIICNVVPGKEQVFKNWSSSIFKTYVSAFIKIFMVTLTVTLMASINKIIGTAVPGNFIIRVIRNGLLYVALFTLLKDGSKYIDELFGLGDTHVGFKDAFSPIKGALGTAAGAVAGTAGFVGGFFARGGQKNKRGIVDRIRTGVQAAKTGAKNRNLSGITEAQNAQRAFMNEHANDEPSTLRRLRRNQLLDPLRTRMGLNTSEKNAEINAESRVGAAKADANGKVYYDQYSKKPGTITNARDGFESYMEAKRTENAKQLTQWQQSGTQEDKLKMKDWERRQRFDYYQNVLGFDEFQGKDYIADGYNRGMLGMMLDADGGYGDAFLENYLVSSYAEGLMRKRKDAIDAQISAENSNKQHKQVALQRQEAKETTRKALDDRLEDRALNKGSGKSRFIISRNPSETDKRAALENAVSSKLNDSTLATEKKKVIMASTDESSKYLQKLCEVNKLSYNEESIDSMYLASLNKRFNYSGKERTEVEADLQNCLDQGLITKDGYDDLMNQLLSIASNNIGTKDFKLTLSKGHEKSDAASGYLIADLESKTDSNTVKGIMNSMVNDTDIVTAIIDDNRLDEFGIDKQKVYASLGDIDLGELTFKGVSDELTKLHDQNIISGTDYDKAIEQLNKDFKGKVKASALKNEIGKPETADLLNSMISSGAITESDLEDKLGIIKDANGMYKIGTQMNGDRFADAYKSIMDDIENATKILRTNTNAETRDIDNRIKAFEVEKKSIEDIEGQVTYIRDKIKKQEYSSAEIFDKDGNLKK